MKKENDSTTKNEMIVPLSVSEIETMLEENVRTLPSDNPMELKQLVIDEFGVEHTLSMNYETMVLTIDGEGFPLLKTTVDSSTGINLGGKIPWKATAILLAAAITAVIPGVGAAASSWAATIVAAVTAEAPDIYHSYTQYRSVEKYWSSYWGSYYNKAICKNVTFRRDSTSGKILCGPKDGNWYDPIRVD